MCPPCSPCCPSNLGLLVDRSPATNSAFLSFPFLCLPSSPRLCDLWSRHRANLVSLFLLLHGHNCSKSLLLHHRDLGPWQLTEHAFGFSGGGPLKLHWTPPWGRSPNALLHSSGHPGCSGEGKGTLLPGCLPAAPDVLVEVDLSP